MPFAGVEDCLDVGFIGLELLPEHPGLHRTLYDSSICSIGEKVKGIEGDLLTDSGRSTDDPSDIALPVPAGSF